MNATQTLIAVTFKLAWRNLWRNYRRTLIMLSAIMLGAWAMIFMTAFLRGMVQDMLERGLDQLPGHMQIHHPAYLDDPNIVHSLLWPNPTVTPILEQSFIRHWYPRIQVPAMITSERENHGVRLIGMDPTKEKETFHTLTIIEGRHLNNTDDTGLIIGKRLAEKLSTGLGKRVVVMSQSPTNEIAERGFKIVGIYQADIEEQEKVAIFGGLHHIQTLLQADNSVTEVAIFVDDPAHAERYSENLHKLLPPNYEIQPWQSLNTLLKSSVNYMDGFVLIWIIVVFLAMSFGLINTLIMAIFERVREIGLMLALGMKGSAITLQILIETLLLLALGLSAGTALAVASILSLQGGVDLSAMAEAMAMAGVGTVLRPQLLWQDILLANSTVIVLGLFSSIFPAWRASKYNPVTALNKTG